MHQIIFNVAISSQVASAAEFIALGGYLVAGVAILVNVAAKRAPRKVR